MTKTVYYFINSKKKKYIYMNLKVEHAIIAVLVLALLYYVYKHNSLLSDVIDVSHRDNPHLKAVKEKHCYTRCCGGALWALVSN